MIYPRQREQGNAVKAGRLLRLNPVIALGSYVVETVVFLMWAPIVEDFLVQQWDRAKVTKALIKAENKLGEVEKNVCYPEEYVEERAKGLQKNLDKWRETIMHKANNTKMRHLMEINKIDMQFQKLAMYYTWLVEGADRDSEYYQANELAWHEDFIVHQINETTDFVEEFFCGVNSDDAVMRYVSYHGVGNPVAQSFNYDFDENRTLWQNMQANQTYAQPTGIKLSKPRVLRLPGTCKFDMRTVNGEMINFWTHGRYEDVICPLDFDYSNKKINYKKSIKPKLHCELELSWARNHILQTKEFKGENIESKLYFAFDNTFGDMMARFGVSET